MMTATKTGSPAEIAAALRSIADDIERLPPMLRITHTSEVTVETPRRNVTFGGDWNANGNGGWVKPS